MAGCPMPKYPFSWPSPIEQPKEFEHLHEQRVIEVELPSGDNALLLTRYEDIRAVLLNPTVSKNRNRPDIARMTVHKTKAFQSQVDMDPPAHTRMRRLVAKAFVPSRVTALRPRIRTIVGEQLDELAAAGPPADINTHLGFPVAIRVACELLGVPQEDRGRFQGAKTPPWDYMRELIERKRAAPGDDLISELITVHDEDDGRLSATELVWWSTILLLAGYETTANQVASAVVLLLTRPDRLAWLRANPDRMPDAVEELLRGQVVGTSLSMLRYLTEDVDLDGVVLPRGRSVVPALESANHDPAVFADRDLDLSRQGPQQLTFSVGQHFCVGAALARAELEIVLSELLTRFPGLALAVPVGRLRRSTDAFTQGFLEVPVRW
ncbi:cytochrome P450 [Amycolatopsis balhimycina DSM 5908]|uniref:Cytochrome P450 n=1 Tax=Amycolatopsis balhimycina DSM 5908 TaxID=1081091 RepID=A0A428WP89_AMYBA|nr:cytochrome P450 [Amycolatopsis balhimycina]RSM44892.1 cytochrome P450 [Amycolatopsis balhimycina DSM 5908]